MARLGHVTTSPDGGPALFRLVRYWSRRWPRGAAAHGADDPPTAQHVLVVTTAAALAAEGAAPTVGDLATALGLDQSGASRMVTAAHRDGYLERHRDSADARTTRVRPTPGGLALVAAAEEWQRARFAELTATWSDQDRARFAGYLTRLADQLRA